MSVAPYSPVSGLARSAQRRASLRSVFASGSLALAALLSGCGGQGGNSLIHTATPTLPPAANIAGQVSSAGDGSFIAKAAVSFAVPAPVLPAVSAASGAASGVQNSAAPSSAGTGNNAQLATDTHGNFIFNAVTPAARIVLHASKAGFVDGYPVTYAFTGNTSEVPVSLMPVTMTNTVPTSTFSYTLVYQSPAALLLNASSLADASGNTVTGNAVVSITPFDASKGVGSFPGDFKTSTGDQLETLGALAVSVADTNGASLSLAPATQAAIVIPYSTRSRATPPTSAPMYFFDPSTGYWVANGTATLNSQTVNGIKTYFYQGNISRFGIWMVGQVISPAIGVTGCVVYSGSSIRVPNVRVVADGNSYSGQSTALTNSSGVFTLPIKSGGTVLISGQLGAFLTNTQRASGSASLTLPNCLSLVTQTGGTRITLTWGQNPNDLDSHLFAPDGTHVWYASKGSLSTDPFASLDVDNTTGFGPEVITLGRLMVGTYTYGVHNFSGDYTVVPDQITASPTQVVLQVGSTPYVYTPTVAMGETSTTGWWTVFRLIVDAHCDVTVVPVTRFDIDAFGGAGDGGPSGLLPTPVARQYCSG